MEEKGGGGGGGRSIWAGSELTSSCSRSCACVPMRGNHCTVRDHKHTKTSPRSTVEEENSTSFETLFCKKVGYIQ